MFSRSEKILLAVLGFINFSHIIDFMIMMPLGPQLMRTFQISPQQFSYLVASYTLSAAVSGFAAAFFLDKYDRKNSLLFFFIGFCLSNIACALSPDFLTLLVSRTLAGFFGGVLGSQVFSIIGDKIPPERRGTAMGFIMTSFSVASIAGVPFSLYLANHFNWHAPFMFLGVLSSFVAILIYYVLPNMKDHIRHKSQSSVDHFLKVIKNSNNVNAAVFMSCLVFSQFLIIPFLSPSLVANAGLAEADLPFIYLVGGSISFLASPLIGRLSDKYGKKVILNIGIPLSLVPFFLITNMPIVSKPILFLCVALLFFGMSGRIVPAMALATSTVKPQDRGTFMSLSGSAQQFAAAMASSVAGAIVVRGPAGELLNYPIVGFISIGASILAWLLAQKIQSID